MHWRRQFGLRHLFGKNMPHLILDYILLFFGVIINNQQYFWQNIFVI